MSLQSLLRRLRNFGRRPCAAVIVAAGSGRRMEGVDKILTELDGKPVLIHTLSAFAAAPSVDEIVIVARREQVETVRALIREYGCEKVKDVVAGGAERPDSVRAGLKAVSARMELVAIQDGARPLVTPEIIERAVTKAWKTSAAAPAVPLKDTVKETDGEGKVTATPNRETLRAVQTPQVFQKDLLRAAWRRAVQEGKSFTDDCAAVEDMGKMVYLVEGSEENLKLTTPLDLRLAEMILERRKES